MKVEIGQIISQIISFLIMLWILNRFAWKPLLRILEERKQKIKGDFQRISEEKNEIEKLREEYEAKLKKIDALAYTKILEATEKGRKVTQEMQQEAQKQAKALLVRAEEQAHQELIKAKSELKSELVKIIISATEKLLKTNMTDHKQKEMVLELIDQFGRK